MLEKLAKMQTELRNYQQQQIKQDSLIRERDAEITDLRTKLSKYEDKENQKNKKPDSYNRFRLKPHEVIAIQKMREADTRKVLVVVDLHEPFCLDGYLDFCLEQY